MIFLLGLILILYVSLITQFIIGFYKVSPFETRPTSPQIDFSIIIPFRNEATNLPSLLNSINEIEYPKALFEIIFIDDHSTDDSANIVKHFSNKSNLNISLLKNSKNVISPKKEAVAFAISKAQNSWILTTDADCTVPSTWLNSYNAFILDQNPDLIAGPVAYFNSNSWLHKFQQLDFLSLQSVTIGGFGIGKPFMCNGANFAYKRSCFHELNGFEGNLNIASGDDLFLLEKAVQNKKKVRYLKSYDAIVFTKPQPNLKSLIQQRIRWASKSSKYKQMFSKYAALLVLLMNLSIIVILGLVVLNIIPLYTLLVYFIIKALVDFKCIYVASNFFRQTKVITTFLVSSIAYPFFTIYVALKSMFSRYNWKERYH